ncbi:MAG TPA: ArsA-related P-loop ATPase [Candidatus Binataceae bacterium]|nr:ArsA-related P-loop ATPase [Candidatus Binataceae bacterium]
MKSDPLDLKSRRLVVCLGAGGVGKTTISAAIAVRTAASGRAVDVMTVDPAPRLLDALGLNSDSSEPREVALDSVLNSRSRSAARARLRALKLDPKGTFDAIVARNAPSAAARDAILENRIYRNLANALAGVADYMAMEKLLELADDATTDMVVLDTPPAAEALDFLDAPRRMLDLLNSRAVSILDIKGGFFGGQMRMFDIAARTVLSAFDRIANLHILADVQSFVNSFQGMYDGFAERAERAQKMLRAKDTAIVVVTTAEPGRIAQAREFIEGLEAAGLKASAIVVNRMMSEIPSAAELAAAKIPAALRAKLKRNLADYAALKRREYISIKSLREALPEGARVLAAPEIGHEPRTIADLAEIGRSLRSH